MHSLLVLCSLAMFIGTTSSQTQPTPRPSRVCQGTSSGRQWTGNSKWQYDEYRARYSNCVIVTGNLELTHLNEDDNYDLSFLHTIEEVTGYVLVVDVHTLSLPLYRLRIIRGWSLYSDNTNGSNPRYALYVAINHKHSSQTVGLQELRLPALSEITSGDVFIHDNFLLCYVETINWSDIISVKATYSVGNTADGIKKMCGVCDTSCQAGCWSNRTTDCQKLSRLNCAEQCYDASTGTGRCFGPGPNQCCHSQCAAGCTGGRNTNCFACTKFNNSGACVDRCPEQFIYDLKLHILVPNPDFRYTYSTLCLTQCPEHMWINGDQCVSDCGAGKIPDENRRCIPCDKACPKECDGTGEDFLDSENIFNFKGCTKVKGRLRIVDLSFQWLNYEWMDEPKPPLEIEQLSMLSDIQEVTEDVFIQANVTNLTSLDFLRNLAFIRRQGQLTDNSLTIDGTNFRTLGGLRSLKSANGNVKITSNRRMCLADSIDWKLTHIIPQSATPTIASNRPASLCAADGIVCHPECRGGCWDVGNTNCIACKNFLYNESCVDSCNVTRIQYSPDNKNCFDCDAECKIGCSGPGSGNCTACLNYRDGPYCVNKCPTVKYNDASGVCQPCSPFCAGGCTGPGSSTVPGGCNSCHFGLILENKHYTAECTDPKLDTCPDGYFKRSARVGPMQHKDACFKCHKECTKCFGISDSECLECRNYFVVNAEGLTCMPQCSASREYAVGQECLPCDDECNGCHGNTSMHCNACKTVKVFELDDDGKETKEFNCTTQCPEDRPYTFSDGHGQTVCSSQNTSLGLILGIVIPVIILLAIVAIIAALVVRHWRRQARKQKLLEPIAPELPLDVTDAKPDMSYLRLVKESELRKGDIIGSGAFGTVYKGFWIPAKESIKIPVAIKVLSTEGSVTEQNKELLDEARIMFSVNHVCCVRVIAICMSQQMMLVTQLMPLGCLLDYVRKNKSNINSRDMLTWSTQIAKGMEYLEHLGIVHRDLAARNVLVQKPNHVRITDFGLARLLEYKQDEYQAQSGKVPIKWLALESIRYRIFTHKTDVWSYGVTLWELFTFGSRPYENISAMHVLSHLEKGERLDQPEICTIDVYMIMIRCWMLDAGSRPTFKELAEEFARMSRDPGRYLVVEGDKFRRLPSTHYKGGEDLDANLHSMSVEMEDIPQTTVSADDYLMSSQIGDDDLDIDIPNDDFNNSPLKQGNRVAMPEDKLGHNYYQQQGGRRSPGALSRYTSDPTRHGDRPPAEPVPMPPLPVAPNRLSVDKQGMGASAAYGDDDGAAAAGVPLLRDQRESEYLHPKGTPRTSAASARGSDYLDPRRSQLSDNSRGSEYLDPRASHANDSSRGSDYLDPRRSQLDSSSDAPDYLEPRKAAGGPQTNGRDSEYLDPRKSQTSPPVNKTRATNHGLPMLRESDYMAPRASTAAADSDYLDPRSSRADNSAGAEYLEPGQKARDSRMADARHSSAASAQPRNSGGQRQSREDNYQEPISSNPNYIDPAKSTNGPSPNNRVSQSNPQYFGLSPTSSQRQPNSPPPVSAKPNPADVARAASRHVYPRLPSATPSSSEAEYLNQSSPEPAPNTRNSKPSESQPQYLDMSGTPMADTRV